MNSFRGPCPHMSVPVETDEHMMSSGLDQAFALACRQCREDPKTINKPEEHDCEEDQKLGPVVSLQRLPERQFLPSRFIPPAHPAHMKPSTPAGVWPGGLRDPAALYEQDFGMGGFSDQPRVCSLDEVESLEPPLTLISDANHAHYNQMGYPAVRMTGPSPLQKRCACCPPPSQPLQNPNIFYNKRHYTAEPGQHHQPSGNRPNTEQEFKHAPNPALGSGLMCAAPSRDVMHEVSVDRSVQPCPGPNTREIKRVISLPEESRNVFITYSVDVAEDMFPFVKFLTDQGFKPAIDIFDDPIQRMSITKWMDRYLNDKSVLIIVVISQKYREDVEGSGDDDHGLHTKYIHNQIQNEFIRQGCLNFRLVPVLFPNATKQHVPNWLQCTRIYRWPRDTTDLLLRLLREERYIIPQKGADLTLTVRPL